MAKLFETFCPGLSKSQHQSPHESGSGGALIYKNGKLWQSTEYSKKNAATKNFVWNDTMPSACLQPGFLDCRLDLPGSPAATEANSLISNDLLPCEFQVAGSRDKPGNLSCRTKNAVLARQFALNGSSAPFAGAFRQGKTTACLVGTQSAHSHFSKTIYKQQVNLQRPIAETEKQGHTRHFVNIATVEHSKELIMIQAISHLIHRQIKKSGAFLTVALPMIFVSLLGSPALAAPAAWGKPVATQIAAGVDNNTPVEALVLLDDAEEQAAEQVTGWDRAELYRANPLEYSERMLERQRRLDSLKTRIRSELTGTDLMFLDDYSVLPLLHVRIASPRALDRLARHSKVLSIDENARNEVYLTQSLPLVGQPTAWNSGTGHGGAGTTVAVLDTGVDYTRAVFGSCTAPGLPGETCKVAYAHDFALTDGKLDDNGHGTNVAGIALGVAPAARIAALDVFRTDGYAYNSDIIAAIDWCVANKATYNIAAINMSLGGGRYYSALAPTDAWGTSIQRAVNSGIVVVAASGNNAYPDSMGLPAAYANVVSVGAVYDAGFGTINWGTCSDNSAQVDRVTCFSNSAPFLTMLAPGAVISAAGINMSGTSQATPHVAGAAAVLRSAFPGDNVQQSVARLQEGPFITDSRNGIAKPRLDLIAALDVVQPAPQILQLGAPSYSVTEGAVSKTIPVSRSGGTAGTVSVQFTTANGTAMAGSDYTATSGTLSFADGVSSQEIVIAITNDALCEDSETFTVSLADPAGAGLGTASSTVTIVDNDKNIEFEAATAAVNEGDGSITLWVKRLGNANAAASVNYLSANGTAKANRDYTATSGTLNWAAGDATSRSIIIPVIDNTTREYSETFKINLRSPVGATLGISRTAIVTIIDND